MAKIDFVIKTSCCSCCSSSCAGDDTEAYASSDTFVVACFDWPFAASFWSDETKI